VTLCDSCEVRTESRFCFVVLLSTLLHAILHPSHHLLNVLLYIANKLGLTNKKKYIVVTLCDSCEVRTESRFHFVVETLCDSCEVRTESHFHFVVVTLCDSCEVRTESHFYFVVLLSTLLHEILHPSYHLLNVLLQIANKLGLSNKEKLHRCQRIHGTF
jgi:hypothetical protein